MSQAKLKVVNNENSMDKENRSKSLEAAVSLIEKNYGKGSIMKLGSKTNVDIEAISTGSLGLDIALGIGGVPKGRIIEIYGPESSGKTTLATHIVAESQKQGGNCAFIDAEHALDPAYAKKLGVNLEELLISQPDTGEQGLEIADSLIKSGGIDVLIIDDVQFFSGKSGTQDVFFHIFNHLHQNGKQLVLTSDKAPVDMQEIEQRLLSRFKWGLSAELQTPDYETRISIVKNKLNRDGVEMDEEIIFYVAKHIKTNVRELEGAIISLMAQSSFNRKNITIDLAKVIVEKFVKNTKKEISIDHIQKVAYVNQNNKLQLFSGQILNFDLKAVTE